MAEQFFDSSGEQRTVKDADGLRFPVKSTIDQTLYTTTATIASGASLSGAATCSTGRLARIDMPAAWTAASLTFQVSNDGVTYNNLYDASGNEYTVTTAASRGVVVPLVDFLGASFLKIRSGTSGSPVTQGADRVLTLQLVP